MKNSRKLISLLLAAILTFSMVIGIAAEEEDPDVTIWFAKTSGGILNLWEGPVKAYLTNIDKIPNGKTLEYVGPSTFSKADNTTMVKVSYGGKTGWVDARFLGKKVVKLSSTLPAPDPEVSGSFLAFAKTTGGKLNVWENKNFTGKKLRTVKNGTVLGVVTTYKGMPYASIDEKGVTGYVRTKYLGKVDTTPKEEPKATAGFENAMVIGTARDSIINLWTNTAKTKKIMRLPVGSVVTGVTTWNNGWSDVNFNVAGEDIWGYIMTRWLKLGEKTWPVE